MTDISQAAEPGAHPAATTNLLVPKEPTAEMIAAAWKYGDYAKSDAPDPVYAYKAMVAVGASQVEQNMAPTQTSVSVLIAAGSSLANLARRYVEEHGQDNRLTQRLDLSRRNWEVLVGSRAQNATEVELTVLEGKLAGMEELLSERDDENATLRGKLIEQQTLLNEAARALAQVPLGATVDVIDRINALEALPVPETKPVEWFDVVDLPAYEPGAQYLILAADEHHPCTELEKHLEGDKRAFRSSLTGCIVYIEDIEAWRPLKDHQPPAGWVCCSRQWIQQGGKCGEAPRWYDGKIGNHYHPSVVQSAP